MALLTHLLLQQLEVTVETAGAVVAEELFQVLVAMAVTAHFFFTGRKYGCKSFNT
jgi:hypothetical protein